MLCSWIYAFGYTALLCAGSAVRFVCGRNKQTIYKQLITQNIFVCDAHLGVDLIIMKSIFGKKIGMIFMNYVKYSPGVSK
jgi:hypothetical protein